jgi:hypothetical protein
MILNLKFFIISNKIELKYKRVIIITHLKLYLLAKYCSRLILITKKKDVKIRNLIV